MSEDPPDRHYQVQWNAKRGRYVATCEGFSTTYSSVSSVLALAGLVLLLEHGGN